MLICANLPYGVLLWALLVELRFYLSQMLNHNPLLALNNGITFLMLSGYNVPRQLEEVFQLLKLCMLLMQLRQMRLFP